MNGILGNMKQFILLPRLITAFVAMTALPATAQQAMNAAEFDAYTQGKTFYYGSAGTPYGGEEYLPNNRVRWSFLDGKCKEGVWYEEAGQICFLYEDRVEPQCWTFSHGAAGLVAEFQGKLAGEPLYEMEKKSEPMLCHGPEVGV